MITGVKQYEGNAVNSCLLQGREPGTGVKRQVDMMRGLVRGGLKERFWRCKMGERAHTANIGRREIRRRPVDFYRDGEAQ